MSPTSTSLCRVFFFITKNHVLPHGRHDAIVDDTHYRWPIESTSKFQCRVLRRRDVDVQCTDEPGDEFEVV